MEALTKRTSWERASVVASAYGAKQHFVMYGPTFASWEAFRASRHDLALWSPLVTEILDRHEIGYPGEFVMASSTHIVALAGPAVVKLYQPLSGGNGWAVETAALTLLRSHGLPVPELLASGELFPEAGAFRWPYCVSTRLAGRPMDEGDTMPADRVRAADFLGRILRAIHGIAPSPREPFAAPDFLAQRLAACPDEHRRRRILPPHLLEQLDDFIDMATSLVLDQRMPVLTHGDLLPSNVHVDGEPGHIRPVGILDFNDMRIVDPHYDLVVVHLSVLNGDLSLLRRLLDSYGWGDLGAHWPRRMLALSLAHDFDEIGDLFRRDSSWASAGSLDELAERLWGLQ